ncbi:hypothetical protein H3U33_19120, partial [Clostridioides difficile]|nr:hypothetical protein [Clostridioides difficile]
MTRGEIHIYKYFKILDFFSSIIFISDTTHPICLFCRIQIQICIKGIHGFKLISYAPGMDQPEHHHRLASTAADWCFRPHGWPIMPPLLGVYVFTDRLAFAAADWCFRLHGWPLCRRCWASTSSPTGRLVRRRLVLPPARLAFMPPLLGVYVFT